MQSSECRSNCCHHAYGHSTLWAKQSVVLDGVVILQSDKLQRLTLSHDCCQLFTNMLGLVNVAGLKIELHYHWRCWVHAAESEADQTVHHPVPFIISEAHITDDIALKETQHAGFGHVDVCNAPAILNDVLHDLLDKMPEEGEL